MRRIRPIGLALLLASIPALLHAQDDPVRHRHPQWPHRRRHRLALVLGRRRHPGRTDRGDRPMLEGASARQTVDAAGQVVAPGFIDMLGPVGADASWSTRASRPRSSRASPPRSPARAARRAPLNDSIIAADRSRLRPLPDHPRLAHAWRLLRPAREAGDRDQLRELRRARPRCAAWSWATATGRPTADELERMKALVREAMRDGAVGVSTSLQYPPAPYARPRSWWRSPPRPRSSAGIYATHMRSEGDRDHRRPRRGDPDRTRGEDPGRDLAPQGWPGKRNWGRMPRVVAKIDSARRAGRGHRGRHLRLSGLVQLDVGLRAAVGARRRRPPSCSSGCAIRPPGAASAARC